MNKLHENSSDILSVCFSPDGAVLAAVDYSKSIELWDVKKGLYKFRLET